MAGNGKNHERDISFTRLATNYENHTRQDTEHFETINKKLDSIEVKLDRLFWKVGGISATVSLTVAILMLIIRVKTGGV